MTMRKIYAILLALIMGIGTSVAKDYHVYYAGNYSVPHLWAWNEGDDGKNFFETWPGVPMTDTGYSFGGKKLWCYTFVDEMPQMVIFSDNGYPQTADMALPGDNMVYTDWLWTPLIFTLYYAGDYDNPYIWAWNEEPELINFFEAWPGMPMIPLEDTFRGKKLWQYQFEESLPQRVVFSNNGSPQTADLIVPMGSEYVFTGSEWVYILDENLETVDLTFNNASWGDNIVSSGWWDLRGTTDDQQWTIAISPKSTERATGVYYASDMLFARIGKLASDSSYNEVNLVSGTFDLVVSSFDVTMLVNAKGEDGVRYNCTVTGPNFYPTYMKHPWAVGADDPWIWEPMTLDGESIQYFLEATWQGSGCNINTMPSNYGAYWFDNTAIKFYRILEAGVSIVPSDIEPAIGTPVTYVWDGKDLYCYTNEQADGIAQLNGATVSNHVIKCIQNGEFRIVKNGRSYNALGITH